MELQWGFLLMLVCPVAVGVVTHAVSINYLNICWARDEQQDSQG